MIDSGIGTGRSTVGITCAQNSSVVVNGDVKVRGNAGSGSRSAGLGAIMDSTVTVNGNVIVSGAATAIGAAVDAGGTATVNGIISAPYVCIGGFPSGSKSIFDYTTPTSKPGYLTYTDDGTNTIWVADSKLSLTAAKTVAKGKKVTIKGALKPAQAGSKAKIVVQYKAGGKWAKAKTLTAAVKADGAYSASWKPNKKGSYRAQATVLTVAPYSTAVSKWVQFKRK